MLWLRASTANSDALLRRLGKMFSDAEFTEPLDKASWRVRDSLVKLTPKRTGNLRSGWQIERPSAGFRRVFNSNAKLMLWIEGGTGWAGTKTSHGGFIYPATKRWLYIPLRPGAAVWHEGLQIGKDYILRKRVRGIKAQRIVENYRPQASGVLREEVGKFLDKQIKQGGTK